MRRDLGSLEARALDAVWSIAVPVSVREVLEHLNASPGKPLAYTTIMTVLDNLYGKGLLTRERDGRAYRYEAVETRDEAAAALMHEALGGSQDRGSALLHFSAQLTPDESTALQKALRSMARRRPS